MDIVYPLAEYWWLYLAFTGLMAILLAVDLIFHRQERPISFRDAAAWTVYGVRSDGSVLYVVVPAVVSPAICPIIDCRLDWELKRLVRTGWLVP